MGKQVPRFIIVWVAILTVVGCAPDKNPVILGASVAEEPQMVVNVEVPIANAAAPLDERIEVKTLPDDLTTEAVYTLYLEDRAVILDVREEWEYTGGHIPGAQLLPLGALSSRLEEVPKDQTVVIVCRSGNRSRQAFNFLREQGFENVHNMLGGMNHWRGAGYDVAQ